MGVLTEKLWIKAKDFHDLIQPKINLLSYLSWVVGVQLINIQRIVWNVKNDSKLKLKKCSIIGLEIYALEVDAMGVFVMIYLPLVVRVLCGTLFSSESRLLTVLFNTF